MNNEQYIIQQTKPYGINNFPFKFDSLESARTYILKVKMRLNVIINTNKNGQFLYAEQTRSKAIQDLKDIESWKIVRV